MNTKSTSAAANLFYHTGKAEHFQLGLFLLFCFLATLLIAKVKTVLVLWRKLNDTLVIPDSSELEQILKEAQLKHPKLSWTVDKKLTQEELLLQVAEGKIAYTIANSLDISAYPTN